MADMFLCGIPDRLAAAVQDHPLALALANGYISHAVGGSTAIGYLKQWASVDTPFSEVIVSVSDIVKRSALEIVQQHRKAAQLLFCLACCANQVHMHLLLMH